MLKVITVKRQLKLRQMSTPDSSPAREVLYQLNKAVGAKLTYKRANGAILGVRTKKSSVCTRVLLLLKKRVQLPRHAVV